MSENTPRYGAWLTSAYAAAKINLDPKCDQLWHLFGLDEEPEEPADREDEEDPSYDRAAHFDDLLSLVPADHRQLSEVSFEIDHSPGLSWDVEMTWFLGPAENPAMEWMLYCINWDDNWETYEVLCVAECQGFPSPELSAAAMLEAVFRNWNLHQDADYPGWHLVDELKKTDSGCQGPAPFGTGGNRRDQS